MTKTVLQKLTAIDERLSQKVGREKIGSLIGRLFFTPNEGDQEEVTIFEFNDLGVVTAPWAGEAELAAHRYEVRISRDWWDENGGLQGKYEIQNSDLDEALVPVVVENQVVDDKQTYVSVTLKVTQEVEISTGIET